MAVMSEQQKRQRRRARQAGADAASCYRTARTFYAAALAADANGDAAKADRLRRAGDLQANAAVQYAVSAGYWARLSLFVLFPGK